MECGIFALLGVSLGVVLSNAKELKISFPKRKVKANEKKEDTLTMAKQWENLLNYDGGGN